MSEVLGIPKVTDEAVVAPKDELVVSLAEDLVVCDIAGVLKEKFVLTFLSSNLLCKLNDGGGTAVASVMAALAAEVVKSFGTAETPKLNAGVAFFDDTSEELNSEDPLFFFVGTVSVDFVGTPTPKEKLEVAAPLPTADFVGIAGCLSGTPKENASFLVGVELLSGDKVVTTGENDTTLVLVSLSELPEGFAVSQQGHLLEVALFKTEHDGHFQLPGSFILNLSKGLDVTVVGAFA